MAAPEHRDEPVIATVVRFGHLVIGAEFVSGGNRYRKIRPFRHGSPRAFTARNLDSGEPARFDLGFLVGVCGQEPEK